MTLNENLHHALTDIKLCREQAEKTQPRIAAHLGAVIVQIEAIIEDLKAGPAAIKRIELVDTRGANREWRGS